MINQSIDWTRTQSLSHMIDQSINQSIHPSNINQSINQSIKGTRTRSLSHMINQSINRITWIRLGFVLEIHTHEKQRRAFWKFEKGKLNDGFCHTWLPFSIFQYWRYYCCGVWVWPAFYRTFSAAATRTRTDAARRRRRHGPLWRIDPDLLTAFSTWPTDCKEQHTQHSQSSPH